MDITDTDTFDEIGKAYLRQFGVVQEVRSVSVDESTECKT